MKPKLTNNAKTLRMELVVLALSLALFILAAVHPVYAASVCRQGAINKGGCAAHDASCISDYCASNPDKTMKRKFFEDDNIKTDDEGIRMDDEDVLMEEIMEEIMEEVREEIKQDIKKDVRQETSEVVAEEQLSPSNSFSGIYLFIDPVDGPFVCNLTITPTNITGSCGDITDAITTFSGSSIDGIFYNFNYTFTDIEFSCGPVPGTGTATVVSGTGEPGT